MAFLTFAEAKVVAPPNVPRKGEPFRTHKGLSLWEWFINDESPVMMQYIEKCRNIKVAHDESPISDDAMSEYQSGS